MGIVAGGAFDGTMGRIGFADTAAIDFALAVLETSAWAREQPLMAESGKAIMGTVIHTRAVVGPDGTIEIRAEEVDAYIREEHDSWDR